MVKTYPKRYDKKEFLKYLETNKVGDNIIEDFESLPESVNRSGDTFKLDIVVNWYPEKESYYEFEMNYYSENTIEYLFNCKVFNNIGNGINYLLCELMNDNYIKKIK